MSNKQLNKKTVQFVNDAVKNNQELNTKLTNQGVKEITTSNFRNLRAGLRSSTPTSSNQFYNDILNKMVWQVVLDLQADGVLQKLINRFSIGIIKEGEGIEVLTSDLVAARTVDLADGADHSPHITRKNKAFVHTIKLGDKLVFPITTNAAAISRAFSSLSGLTTFIGQIARVVSKSIDNHYWKLLKTTIVDYTPPVGAPAIKIENVGVAATSTATEIYTAVETIVGEMEFPSTAYNEGVSVGGAYTPLEQMYMKKDLILVLNPKNAANFNVNVLASLFNSSKLEINNLETIKLPFTQADNVTPITDADKTVGFLMSRDRIKFAYGEKSIEQSYSPNGQFLDTFGNVSAAMGHVPFANLVQLKLT